jgi:glutamate/tyrosine decarboxylase-like PLP-dependent enzyme
MPLPEKGLSRNEILAQLEAMRAPNADWHAGRTFSLVYHSSDEHLALLKEAYTSHFSENGLNPTAFPSLALMERDLISITGMLFHAPEGFAGTFQSGGTESILCAMLAYRDRALSKGIARPELVLSEAAHVAFLKASHYFGFSLKLVPIDAEHRVSVDDFRALISKNTMAIVGSAPAYPSGQIDPLADLSALAVETGVPLHVDACVGGYLLPFLENIPPWDFRLPGVTSISADLHKYGFAAKGASTLLWRSDTWLNEQIYVYADWPGGVYASTGLLGTRPGGSYAAAWAAMQAFGLAGYRKQAAHIMQLTRKIIDGVLATGAVRVLGTPEMSVFALVSADKSVSMYALADILEEKGWFIDRQQEPESIHFTITPAHAASADAFLADFNEAVETARREPGRAISGKAAQYGLIRNLPLRSFVSGEVKKTMANMVTGRAQGVSTRVPAWQRWLLRLLRK